MVSIVAWLLLGPLRLGGTSTYMRSDAFAEPAASASPIVSTVATRSDQRVERTVRSFVHSERKTRV